ncbi:MAG: hypothetical protein WC686_04135 [Candidatus Shapirobacteria bacterium]|jgi:hypothetical protein
MSQLECPDCQAMEKIKEQIVQFTLQNPNTPIPLEMAVDLANTIICRDAHHGTGETKDCQVISTIQRCRLP